MRKLQQFALLTLIVCVGFLFQACDEGAESTAPELTIIDTVPNSSESDTTSVDNMSKPGIVVLGTAQDAGYPQINCKKSCCMRAWNHAPLREPVSCLGLYDPESDQIWMFDATPDFKEQLNDLQGFQQNGTHPIDGIFLTHGHIGHYTGIMDLGREAMGANEVPVYAMPRMVDYLTNNGPWSQLVSLHNIKLKNMAADSSIQLNERLSVTPLLVPHRDEFTETVGFKIEGPNLTAVFIPDIDKWHKWDRNIVELVNSVDLLFLDGTFYRNGEIAGRDMNEIPHPFIEESMELFKELPEDQKRKIHFIHFNHTNPIINPESEESQEVETAGFKVARTNNVYWL